MPIPNRRRFQLRGGAESPGSEIRKGVEKLGATNSIAKRMTKPNPNRRRSILKPRQLNNQGWRSIQRILLRKRQKPPPLGDRGRRAVEVLGRVAIRNGLKKKRPLRARNNLQTGGVGPLPNPTGKREVGNQNLGQSGSKGRRNGGAI